MHNFPISDAGRFFSLRFALAAAGLLFAVALTPARADYRGPVAAPTDVYGSAGPYAVVTETLPSPDWPGHVVTVLRPQGAPGKRPVWFFAHGFGGTDPAFYRELLEHLASHGAVVVFSPYPTELLRVSANYATLFDGFVAAVAHYAEIVDTTRVGFAGHSYGGGAVPALALRGVREQGWGTHGVALLLLAPWYSYFVTDADLAAFPAGTKAVVEVYEDDTMNDHRMAIDVYQHLGVAAEDKDYLMLRSDRIDGYNYAANHLVPTGAGNPRNGAGFDALDAWGVLRIAQALAAATWDGDAAARGIALGHGAAVQVQMGATAGGRALRPMVESRAPVPLFPSNRYLQPWNGGLNPRPASAVTEPTPAPHLANLSARAFCAGPDDPLVIGAAISGGRPKSLLVRAVGPALAGYGVSDACPDPAVRIYDGTRLDLAVDDWSQSPDLDALAATTNATGAFPLPTGSADAAVLASFGPGTLTAHGAPAAGTSGTVLVEAYDAEDDTTARLGNLSVRARVDSEKVLVAGFVIAGPGRLRLLIRGVGPRLADFGVTDSVPDPALEIYRGADRIGTNDNWADDAAQAGSVAEAAAATGAFSLPPGSPDAAAIVTLPAGAYSAVVRSRAGGAGTALAELYVLAALPEAAAN